MTDFNNQTGRGISNEGNFEQMDFKIWSTERNSCGWWKMLRFQRNEVPCKRIRNKALIFKSVSS